MVLFLKSSITISMTFCLLSFCDGYIAEAAMDPRFELDPTALSGFSKPTKPTKKSEKRANNQPTAEKRYPTTEKVESAVYTVKAGDRLLKILMRDYRLSYSEAENFIEEIRRKNNICDVNLIRTGQKIIIPPVRRHPDGSLNLIQSGQAESRSPDASETPGQSFKLESPLPMLSEKEVVDRIRETWGRIVPAIPNLPMLQPLVLQTSTFSLTLDAERYPTFTAMDGGRILLDQGNSIPPLVKSLIQEKEPSLRIVSDSLSGMNTFIASMLKAGRFHSVEENFSMDFGVDPKLSFRADFKIEKGPESLINQDIVLMNSGLTVTPPVLGEFLKKKGFSLYEPFATVKNYAVNNSRTVHQITSNKQPDMVDAILEAFSITPDRDRRLDVFATENNGISLSVNAERYFERGGQRFIITIFNGDPVNYTLFRILETKGYQVVILDAQDDFRKVSEKILHCTKIKGTFAKHDLLPNSTSNYSLQMSGFNLEGDDLAGGGIFLTNLEMDQIIRDLLTENGYSFNRK